MCDDENVKQKLSLEIRRTGGTEAREEGGGRRRCRSGGDEPVQDLHSHGLPGPIPMRRLVS